MSRRGRTSPPSRPDTHVRYSRGVASRQLDRTAWAAQVSELLRVEAGGNKTRLAEMVGVTSKTIDRWLKGQVDVSEQSVREVAKRLSRDQVRLLVTVGYYEDGDLRAPAPELPTPADDDPDAEAIELINKADIPHSLRLQLIAELKEESQQDAARRRNGVLRSLRMRTA